MDEVLTVYKEVIQHGLAGANFGEMEIVCKEKRVAVGVVGCRIMSEKWVLFPTCMELSVLRIRVGRISPLMES